MSGESQDQHHTNSSSDFSADNNGQQFYAQINNGLSGTSRRSTWSEPELCKEQQDLVDLIASGRNVFYTGSAGSGKSTVLKTALRRLEDNGLQVHVLAPTGRAALQVNGTTTWTYMGWTPNHHKSSIEDLKLECLRKPIRRRLRATDVLVIDEISMIENHHLERINICMKEIRKRDAAFGGVQVIVTGDFCQLPPVKPFRHCITCGSDMQSHKYETMFSCPECQDMFYDYDKWAFMSPAWEECDFTHVHLKQIHRQKDEQFIKMLQKCRLGLPFRPHETMTLMNHPCNVANATQLFSTRKEVKEVNEEKFNMLQTPIVTFHIKNFSRLGLATQRALPKTVSHVNIQFEGAVGSRAISPRVRRAAAEGPREPASQDAVAPRLEKSVYHLTTKQAAVNIRRSSAPKEG